MSIQISHCKIKPTENGMKHPNIKAKLLFVLGVLAPSCLLTGGWVCAGSILNQGGVIAYGSEEECTSDTPAAIPGCGPAPTGSAVGVWCKVEPIGQLIAYRYIDEFTEECITEIVEVPDGRLYTGGRCCPGD
ncbi:hypothetical protein EON79_07910 [bacterium]|nr:MAG: hypothetical protein EON79_07910 [bacterium]